MTVILLAVGTGTASQFDRGAPQGTNPQKGADEQFSQHRSPDVAIPDDAYDGKALVLASALGTLAVSLVVLPFLERPAVVWVWPMVWRFLVLGTMAALTIALQLHWQRFISATRAAIIFTLEPPLAALFATRTSGSSPWRLR